MWACVNGCMHIISIKIIIIIIIIIIITLKSE